MSQRPWTRLLGIDRWFECRSCGQLVRGWRASEDIRCCENKQLVEIFPLVSLDDIHEQALKEHAVYVNKVTKLKVQRDELLAACEMALEVLEYIYHDGYCGCDPELYDGLCEACLLHDAIAAAKGE